MKIHNDPYYRTICGIKILSLVIPIVVSILKNLEKSCRTYRTFLSNPLCCESVSLFCCCLCKSPRDTN